MSQENVELVQFWFKRWNGGDWNFTDELHPDFQVVSRLQAEPFEGREGLHRWMQEVDEQFGEWQLVADEWLDAGDRVLSRPGPASRERERCRGGPTAWMVG